MEARDAPPNAPFRRATLLRLTDAKTMSFFTGVCLLVNAMTGPSMPFTASLFQDGGLLPPTLFFILFTILSTLSCLFIVEAMQSIPGNKHFQGMVEFATLVNFYFGKKMHWVAQMCLYGAIQSNAIQSIVLSAQTLDNILVDIFRKSCGISSAPLGWMCVENTSDTASPFGETIMLFTLGFLIVIVVVLPMAILDFEDNMIMQMGAFVVSGFIILQWIIACFLYMGSENAEKPTVEVVGKEVHGLAGTIMLSMAYTFVVPSWINLKKKEVNAQATLWTSSIITCIMYLIIGIIPTLAFPVNEAAGGNILPTLSTLGIPQTLTKITCYAFSLVMLLPSIPVSCIVSRNNLIQNDICHRGVATFLTFVVPWLVAIPFLSGSALGDFLNWSSLLFVSTANFIIPVIIYLKSVQFRQLYNQERILSPNQKKLLKSIHEMSHSIIRWVDYVDKQEGAKCDSSTHSIQPDPPSRPSSIGSPTIVVTPAEEKMSELVDTYSLSSSICTLSTESSGVHCNSLSSPPSAHCLSISDLARQDPLFYRRMSLPADPDFVSRPFYSLPSWMTERKRWFKVGPLLLAKICIFLTSAVTLLNIGFSIVKLVD